MWLEPALPQTKAGSVADCRSTEPWPYLIQGLLQVRGAHAVSHVPVGRVGEEELPLSRQRRADVLLALDVLLAAVHHTDVACGERGSGQGQCQVGQGAWMPTVNRRQTRALSHRSLTDEAPQPDLFLRNAENMNTQSSPEKQQSVWRKEGQRRTP